MNRIILVFCVTVFLSCGGDKNVSKTNEPAEPELLSIQKAKSHISIDGVAHESDWLSQDWRDIDQLWLGTLEDETDFQGWYKLLWSDTALYVFAKTIDDTLMDIHVDPMERYWDDDCLEVFIDENNSKGNHQYNHNAFAYHIALDGNVMDIGPDSLVHYYNDHMQTHRRTIQDTTYWELAIQLYGDNYVDAGENSPLNLKQSKQIGFAIAYCDNDRSAEREAFIGSVYVEGEDKNRGWIDAGIFESCVLK